MTMVPMFDKLAIMSQASVTITIGGNSFDMPAQVPFSTAAHEIDLPSGTIIAIMRSATNSGQKVPLQVFSIDEIITVA